MEIDKVLRNVPDYKVFFTVDEFNKNSEELVEEFPGEASFVSLGRSGKGEEISALKIGEGSFNAVLVGGIHPFEPVGSLMQDYLSRTLLENPEYLKDLDVSWTLIKCIDPDRMKMNEGWFKEPRTPLNFVKNLYRPALRHQVSCNFPIEYKTWIWNNILPETQCLMDYIDAYETNLMFELHNSWLSGTWYRITKDCPPLYPVFRELSVKEKIPLNARNGSMISKPTSLYSSIEEMYERIFKNVNDSRIQMHGVSPVYYTMERWNSFGLLCEVPYFFDPRVADESLSGTTMKEAVTCEAKIRRDLVNFLQLEYKRVKPYLHDSPYKDSVEELIERESIISKKQEHSIRHNDNMNKPVTIAQELQSCAFTIFEPDMSTLGMFRAMLQYEKERSTRNIPEIQREIEEVTQRLEERNDQLMKQLDLHVAPLRSLVRIQLGACLHTINYLQNTT